MKRDVQMLRDRGWLPNVWDAVAFALIIGCFVAIAAGAQGTLAPLTAIDAAPR